jgi:hypothetical protein
MEKSVRGRRSCIGKAIILTPLPLFTFQRERKDAYLKRKSVFFCMRHYSLSVDLTSRREDTRRVAFANYILYENQFQQAPY